MVCCLCKPHCSIEFRGLMYQSKEQRLTHQPIPENTLGSFSELLTLMQCGMNAPKFVSRIWILHIQLSSRNGCLYRYDGGFCLYSGKCRWYVTHLYSGKCRCYVAHLYSGRCRWYVTHGPPRAIITLRHHSIAQSGRACILNLVRLCKKVRSPVVKRISLAPQVLDSTFCVSKFSMICDFVNLSLVFESAHVRCLTCTV